MRTIPILLILVLALSGCTSTQDLDKDLDGIEDADELQGTDITITTATGSEVRHVTSDPGNPDTDGDGLLDGDEMHVRGTDPRNADTDGDGLLDGKDVVRPASELATRWRTQGILEINATFLGELDQCPPGGAQLDPARYSSDLPLPDALGDGDELRGWDVTWRGETRHVTSDPCTADADKDGLRDDAEKRLGTDPRNADTDGDGAIDGQDADPLHDLALRFGPAEVARTNGTGAVVLRFVVGQTTTSLTTPGNTSADLDVPDTSPDTRSLETSLILTAEDLTTGEPLALFSDPRGAILVIDLVKGTASGADAGSDATTLRFAGADGSLTLTWKVQRT